MCPICSIGVVVSLGLSRWLKVDDSISGVWVGALILAFSLWTFAWLFRKRDKKPLFFLPVIVVVFWLLTFLPLYATGVISNVNCLTILGLNRLVFGSLLGILLTALSLWLDKLLRRIRQGGVLFPYQKVVLPLAILLLASLVLNVFCR
jgi:hypothetical protein